MSECISYSLLKGGVVKDFAVQVAHFPAIPENTRFLKSVTNMYLVCPQCCFALNHAVLAAAGFNALPAGAVDPRRSAPPLLLAIPFLAQLAYVLEHFGIRPPWAFT